MKRQLSGPTRELLREAQISPDEVDAAFDALVSEKASAMLRRHHRIVQKILLATGIDVIQISRKSRCLLIETSSAVTMVRCGSIVGDNGDARRAVARCAQG